MSKVISVRLSDADDARIKGAAAITGLSGVGVSQSGS